MKILFGSDFHGLDTAYLNFSHTLAKYDYDIGIISGDLSTYSNDLEKQERFLKDCITNITNKPVFFIMGNDDGLLYNKSWNSKENFINVNQSRINIEENLNIVGYQYTPTFIGGAFEKNETEIKKDLFSIENLVDNNTILITHGPPKNILDKTFSGENVGSKSLFDFVDKMKPKFHLFGHIHHSFGVYKNFINGSYPVYRKYMFINTDNNTVEII